MKKRAKLRKQIRMYNKKLIKKYPWLHPEANWYTGRILKHYDYEWTWWDDMPKGWNIAFGKMLLNELDDAIRRGGLLQTFKIDQLKEKYGVLTIYDHGGNQETDDIICKYSYISECVCAHCGAVDVKMTNAGWILPLCKRCFERNINTTRTYDEVTSEDDDGKIPNKYIVKRWHKDKPEETIEYDISETVKKVRERYEKRIQKRRSRQ